jgi:hypothetical protein
LNRLWASALTRRLAVAAGLLKHVGKLSSVLMEGRSMKLPAYEVFAQAFVAEGVDTVFTLMGDANMHWANALARHNGVRPVVYPA